MDDASRQPEQAERIRRGDVGALAAAFETHDRRLTTIVSFRLDSRLSRRVEPVDVLQEAYLNAAKRCTHLQGASQEALFIWLRLIVLQTIADVHRRHLGTTMRDAGRERALGDNGHSDNTSFSLASRLVGPQTSPSGALHRVETAEALRTALAEMNETDREVLALRHFEELSNQEVAAALGIGQKAASIRYVRALRKLRELVSGIPGLSSLSAMP